MFLYARLWEPPCSFVRNTKTHFVFNYDALLPPVYASSLNQQLIGDDQ